MLNIDYNITVEWEVYRDTKKITKDYSQLELDLPKFLGGCFINKHCKVLLSLSCGSHTAHFPTSTGDLTVFQFASHYCHITIYVIYNSINYQNKRSSGNWDPFSPPHHASTSALHVLSGSWLLLI